MRKQRILSVVLAAMMICLTGVAACAEEVVSAVMSAGTTQAFTNETIPEDDMNLILQAGLSAASAMNAQPWFFAVVTNKEVMAEISAGMSFGGAPAGAKGTEDAATTGDETAPDNAAPAAPATSSAKAALGDSPAAIVIYMDESGVAGTAAFDCGLACQNMVVAANALGYGTKIVSSPTMALNGDNHDALCGKLGVDASLKAVAVLLLGKADEATDGISGATTRSDIADKVSFVE